jgi:hypothetical protein
MDTSSQAHIRVQTGRPRLCFDSHEARSTGSLDPGKPTTRTTQGQAGRPPLTHLLTNKAFNATTSANVATAPPAWEQHPCLILLFTAHPGMAVKKLPLFTPRRALFYHRRPLDSQDDNHRARVFWGSVLSVPRRPPSVASRPSLERRRSTEEQHTYIDHKGSHTRHRTQGLSPSHHQRHMTPQGWPAFTDARRYSNLYIAHRAFTSKAPP